VKMRIKHMKVRAVNINKPNVRAVFKVYAAERLNIPHKDFIYY